MRLASEIECKEVPWLWYPYIPAGMVTILEGDPGVGKSWLICALTAALTRGDPLPGQDNARAPATILLLSAEDSLEHTIVPRLRTLGADLDRVHLVSEPFAFDAKSVAALESEMATCEATICFIDPIQSFMGNKTDSNKMTDVRAMMSPLIQAASRTGCAIVALRHLRKGSSKDSGPAIYAGMGSIDFMAAVRSALQVTYGQEDERIVTHAKCNVGPIGPTMAYTLADNSFQWSEHSTGPKGRSWSKRLPEAQDFLRKLLASGKMPVKEIEVIAESEQISKVTLMRAKVGLVISSRDASRWYWELIPSEQPVASNNPPATTPAVNSEPDPLGLLDDLEAIHAND